jgi:uncharacterized repeat protein (TIGR01451 family)
VHGQPAFHGEQDQDPLNATDCRTGSPGDVVPPFELDVPQALTDRHDEVRIAELQVFSSGTGSSGGGGGDCDGGDDDDDDDDDIAVNGPLTARAGSNVTYSITYRNMGSRPDNGCEIDDLLGPGLAYVSSTGGTFNAATRTVRWNLSGVAPGASETVRVTARVTGAVGAVLLNQAWFRRLGVNSPTASATTIVIP